MDLTSVRSSRCVNNSWSGFGKGVKILKKCPVVDFPPFLFSRFPLSFGCCCGRAHALYCHWWIYQRIVGCFISIGIVCSYYGCHGNPKRRSGTYPFTKVMCYVCSCYFEAPLLFLVATAGSVRHLCVGERGSPLFQ
jgi:hypothetical protein